MGWLQLQLKKSSASGDSDSASQTYSIETALLEYYLIVNRIETALLKYYLIVNSIETALLKYYLIVNSIETALLKYYLIVNSIETFLLEYYLIVKSSKMRRPHTPTGTADHGRSMHSPRPHVYYIILYILPCGGAANSKTDNYVLNRLRCFVRIKANL